MKSQQDINTTVTHINTLSNTGKSNAIAIGENPLAIDNSQTIQQVYKGFAPEMLQDPIKDVLDTFHNGKHEIAKVKLETLKSLSTQNAHIESALNIVSIYLGLIKAEEVPSTQKHLIDFLRSFPDDKNAPNLIYDLCIASLIHLASDDGDKLKIKQLRTTYKKFWSIHSDQAYFTKLADEEELEYPDNKLLTANELRGLIEGSIRITNFNLAQKYISELKKQENTDLLKFQEVIVNISLMQKAEGMKTVWSITATIYENIQAATEILTELLNMDSIVDQRLPRISAGFFTYLEGFESEEFRDACWLRVIDIEKTDKHCGAILRSHYEKDFSGRSKSTSSLYKAHTDKNFRHDHVKEILSKQQVKTSDVTFLANHADHSKIREWLNDGGFCVDESPLAADIANVYLHAVITDDNKHSKDIQTVVALCTDFLKKHKTSHNKLNPSFMVRFSSQLLDIKSPYLAVSFIKPLLPDEDYWLSPLVELYIDALYNAEQFKTLDKVINNLNKSYWNGKIWQIKAQLSYLDDDIATSKSELEISLDKQFNLYTLLVLINTMAEMQCSKNSIIRLIDDVPNHSLNKDHYYSPFIVAKMFQYDLTEKAINILLDWFIESPQDTAKLLTDSINGLTFNGIQVDLEAYDHPTIVGVNYKNKDSEENQQTKLIVPKELAHSEFFISASSPLGVNLLALNKGDNFEHQYQKYTVVDKHSAIITAYHIALSLRSSMNQGNDSFCMFQTPTDDTKKLFEQLQRVMHSQDKSTKSIVTQPDIPILLKGHLLYRTDPMRAALHLLTDPTAPKNLLPKIADSTKRVTKILLDIYTISYLSVTGVVDGLITSKINLFISGETQGTLKQWLQDRKGDDKGSLSLTNSGKLNFIESEEIRNRTSHTAEGIENILAHTTVLPAKVIDLPHEVLKIRDILDETTWSTIRLAVTHQIEWFCIDSTIAYLLHHSNVPIILDAQTLMTSISALTSLSQKKAGLFRTAYEDLPFPVLHQDLWDLSQDREGVCISLLAKIIRKPLILANTPDDQITTLQYLFLSSFTNCLTQTSFRDTQSLHNSRFPVHLKEIAYATFYAVIRVPSDNTAEHKLSLLIFGLENELRKHKSLSEIFYRKVWGILNALLHSFIQGHFLSLNAIDEHLEQLNVEADSNAQEMQQPQQSLKSA